MSEEQYYRLELNDVATPSFTSFGKNYYGTMVQDVYKRQGLK